MFRIIPTWRLASRHGQSNWRLLAVLAFGILVAAVLLASAPIYSRAMADLGLTFTIREELEDRAGATVEVYKVPLQTADGVALRGAIEGRIDERIGWFRDSQSRYLQLPRLRFAKSGGEQAQFAAALHLQTQQGYDQHVNVTEGRLPAAVPAGQAVETAMSARIAAVVGVKVGDKFDMLEDFDTCEREIPQGDNPPPPPPCDTKAIAKWRMPAVLVGIAEPKIENDSFWVAGVASFFEPQSPYALPGEGPNVAVWVDESTITATFAGLYPSYYTTARWNVFANPETLSRRNFQRATSDITGLQDEMESLKGYLYGPLESTLVGFGKRAGHQQTPLTILLLEIAGVALFYTALVAATVVERQGAEITLFRSRGASTWQIASIYLFEGLYLAVPIVIVAPFLAAGSTALLGLTPLFHDVSNGDLLPVVVPPVAFAMAALGAALGVAALLLPVIVVASRGALAHRRGQARPGVSFIQRYYLDLVFAALAGLLLWELNEKGSAFEPSATGGVSSDPVLLASPALIIAAVAALILRFYPMVLKVVSRMISFARAVTLTMSVWQLSRSPGQYTRLALLLMMAIAVGTYAASYSSTAERSFRDRANFEAGVDLRAHASGSSQIREGPVAIAAKAKELPGVTGASAVYRSKQGQVNSQGSSGQQFQVLGVNPAEVTSMLWFRPDFAELPLEQLLGLLRGPADLSGKPLPGVPQSISVWVNPSEGAELTTMRARFRDSNDNNWSVELGVVGPPGWHELTAVLPEPSTFQGFTPPVKLMSFEVFEPPNPKRGAQKPILIDDISVRTADGVVSIVDNFENASTWSPLPLRATIPDEFVVTTDTPHSGKQAGKFTYSANTSQSGSQGFYVTDALVPLGVIASNQFTATTGLGPGATGLVIISERVIPISVRANFDLFPTMPSDEGPALVFNRDQLLHWMNTYSIASTARAEELWFSLAADADRAMLDKMLFAQFGLDRAIDRENELRKVKSNPLIVAGGTGILVVAFLAVLGLVGAAMLVSLWTAVQRRRVEFAVLRALGTSSGQVFRVLTLEYLVVVVIGLVGGGYLGLFVARRMLSFLNVTENGDRVEPSFILQTNWAFVAASGGVVLLVFAVALVFAVRQLSRISDAQALRTE